MNMQKSLSLFLKSLRHKNGKERLSAMAKKLGVSASYLSSVENGKKPMSEKLYSELIKQYQLSDKNIKELNILRYLESKTMNLDTDDMDQEKKEVVINFLSNIDSMNEDDLKKLNRLINKK